MRFFLRAIYFGILRFAVMLALLTSIIYLDTSPLPEAPVYVALSYIIHFGATWIFARWVFLPHMPTWAEALGVFALFTVISISLEMGLQAWITGNLWLASLGNLNWQSLLVLIAQALAVLLATWQAQRSKRGTTPEGLSR